MKNFHLPLPLPAKSVVAPGTITADFSDVVIEMVVPVVQKNFFL